MKVFISWSGSPSGEIAEQLRDWLPLILPAAKPFITRADINKGANWPGAIRHELEQSHYGIVCLTGGNVSSAWLAFEAGALSKQLESRVATVLFGLNHNEVPLPLGMFQGTSFNETDMRLLINSMNTAADLEERRSEKDLDKVFSRFWPDLNDPVTSILSAHASEEPPRNPRSPARSDWAMPSHVSPGASKTLPVFSAGHFPVRAWWDFAQAMICSSVSDGNRLRFNIFQG